MSLVTSGSNRGSQHHSDESYLQPAHGMIFDGDNKIGMFRSYWPSVPGGDCHEAQPLAKKAVCDGEFGTMRLFLVTTQSVVMFISLTVLAGKMLAGLIS